MESMHGRDEDGRAIHLDVRGGCVAVYVGEKRNCLDGVRDDLDCLFYAHGHRFGGEWIVTPAACSAAYRVFDDLVVESDEGEIHFYRQEDTTAWVAWYSDGNGSGFAFSKGEARSRAAGDRRARAVEAHGEAIEP